VGEYPRKSAPRGPSHLTQSFSVRQRGTRSSSLVNVPFRNGLRYRIGFLAP
jgi:hypothetical protein